MFDIGFAEMMIIGIVALLVIGPERLPSVARKAGHYLGRLKRFVSNVRSDVEREFRTDELQKMLQQQQDELRTLKDAVNETRQEADLGSIEETMRDTAKDVVEGDEKPASTDAKLEHASDVKNNETPSTSSEKI